MCTTALYFVICWPNPYEISPKGVRNCNCDGYNATLVALPDKAGTTETTSIFNNNPTSEVLFHSQNEKHPLIERETPSGTNWSRSARLGFSAISASHSDLTAVDIYLKVISKGYNFICLPK